MSVTVEYRRNIAIVTLNNAKKLNALTSHGYFLLAQHMRDIAEREDVSVTVLVGKGRFFSAGADIKDGNLVRERDQDLLVRQRTLRNLSHILEVTEAFYTHPKVLVSALNGPIIGLSAALVSHSDFIYAMPHTYLHTPFASLGIAAEGGSTVTFTQRLGATKAAEALLMSKRISCEELVRDGFINEVFDTKGNEEQFLERVLQEVESCLIQNANMSAVLQIKSLMRKQQVSLLASQTLAETMGVVDKISSHTASAASRSARAAKNSQKSKL